jgi:hypothetical protein
VHPVQQLGHLVAQPAQLDGVPGGPGLAGALDEGDGRILRTDRGLLAHDRGVRVVVARRFVDDGPVIVHGWLRRGWLRRG